MRALAIGICMLLPVAALAQASAPAKLAQEDPVDPAAPTGRPSPLEPDPEPGATGEDGATSTDAEDEDEVAAGDEAGDDEFEEDTPTPSLMFGPVGRGELLVSADVGWLRSALQANLGFGGWVDLVLRVETLLLYRQFQGQTGVHAGVRLSPVSGELLRASAEGTIGQMLVPGNLTITSVTVLRGELTLGAALDWASFGARLGFRALSDSGAGAGWTSQTELGLGAERAFGKLVVGAEAFVWSRSGLDVLPQWRLRVGYAP